ncbi:MAG TPA: SHOCT domain-containing protein [Leptospiraceae bacterium]|nr:SHOCT domain-containing protein [Leptospiraceae bacterium]HNN78543.1 SHOCT domain-containing protein [Leptospiraceae bacterium]
MKWIYLFSICVFVFSCISFERGLKSKLKYSGSNLAIYELNQSIFEKYNKEKKNIDLSDLQLKRIFLTLRKERSFIRFLDRDSLWSVETIDEMVPPLLEILSLKNNKTYFVIVKEEDKTSPYARIFRTSFYLNRDDNHIQIVFGEVNDNINFGTQFSFTDWANPTFFKITCRRDRLLSFYGKYEIAFKFKQDPTCSSENKPSYGNDITSLENYSWILIDLNKVLEANTDKPIPVPVGNREQRLRELLKLYKKGLISKEDYELKKAEIIGEI